MTVTAKDMQEYINQENQNFDKEIDDWLTFDVFPSIMNDQAVVDIPVEFLGTNLEANLVARGFNIEFVDDPQLHYPKIIIKP